MKNLLFVVILLIVFSNSIFGISPFFKMVEKEISINNMSTELQSVLKTNGYDVLGVYNVGGDASKMVIVFTNSTIKNLALGYEDRGGLAIAQKIGLIHKDGKTTVSLLNPIYMFNAYFQEDFKRHEKELNVQVSSIKKMFTDMNFTFTPFGGDVEIDDLQEYQYMMGMPEFTDPVKLETYDSFNEGVKIIRDNLKANKENTVKVYEIVSAHKKVAVFGIGLLDAEKGESNFLSIIGEDQLAAMPYEIILQDNKATILHGRFRFALYWPELTMSTFTKIMSTPGYVEDVMEEIADDD